MGVHDFKQQVVPGLPNFPNLSTCFRVYFQLLIFVYLLVLCIRSPSPGSHILQADRGFQYPSVPSTQVKSSHLLQMYVVSHMDGQPAGWHTLLPLRLSSVLARDFSLLRLSSELFRYAFLVIQCGWMASEERSFNLVKEVNGKIFTSSTTRWHVPTSGIYICVSQFWILVSSLSSAACMPVTVGYLISLLCDQREIFSNILRCLTQSIWTPSS